MANNNRQPSWDDPLSQEEFFDYLPAVCNALLAGEDVATGFENLRREAQLLLGPAPASLGGDHGSERSSPSPSGVHMGGDYDDGYYYDDGFFYQDESDDDEDVMSAPANANVGVAVAPDDDSDDDDIFAPEEPMSPAPYGVRRLQPSYRERQVRREENLEQMLPWLYRRRLAVLGRRSTKNNHCTTMKPCARCNTIGHTCLWMCVECSIAPFLSPLLCSSCLVETHINNPHACQVWADGELFFRSPRSDETVVFKLRPFCQRCSRLSDTSVLSKRVLVLTPTGAFDCEFPVGETVCVRCGHLVSPVDAPSVGCTPCDATLDNRSSPPTWVSMALMSLVLSLRSEAANSINSIARALRKSWLPSLCKEESFVTVNWLERKLGEAISNEILLSHPSWMDPSDENKLIHKFSTQCICCADRCQNVHIDGFFKMKRMKRPLSLRPPWLKFFCSIDRGAVDALKQADLEEERVNVPCADVDGAVTRFRSGSGGTQKQDSYAQTGVVTAVCPHGVPLRVLPMNTRGEKFYLPHAVIKSLESTLYPRQVDFYSYDVSCKLGAYLRARDEPLAHAVENKLVLGHFHSKSHKCKRYNVSWSRTSAGMDDGEQGERWNSRMVNFASSMRYMREERSLELLEHLMLVETRESNSNISHVLRRRANAALKSLVANHESLTKKVADIESRLSACGYHVSREMVLEWSAAYVAPPSVPSANIGGVGLGFSLAEVTYVRRHMEWTSRCADTSIDVVLEHKRRLEQVNNRNDLQSAELSYLSEASRVHARLTRARSEVSGF